MVKGTGVTYRRHSIKTLAVPSGYQARAFRGGKAVGEVFEGGTQAAAVLVVKDYLDSQAAELCAKRGVDGFPCADEIRIALTHVTMNKAQEAMLAAHLAASNHILTATELAYAAGYDDYAVANRQYGQLAYDLAQELEWTPIEKTGGVTTWTFVLADDADKQGRDAGAEITGQWRWKLRPEIIEALT